VVVRPTFVSTRAVTIEARPAAVWPWLIQLGQGRGGLYSYDRLENLFGLDIHSAARIVPDLQRLEVGDRVSLGKGAHMVVHAVEPERALLLRHPDGDWSWSFVLEPLANGSSRLTVRNRWTIERARPAERLGLKVAELPAFVMERKMLLGLKERAEGNP
jgi:hypothetical protein